MSTDEIILQVEKREVLRKGLRKLRDDGQIPAVIHDHGKPSMHVTAEYTPLLKAFQQAGKHNPVKLNIDGKQHLTIIKDADFEPTKNRLRHVVFQAIKQNETVSAEVPVVLIGEVPAERKNLLVLQQLDVVTIEALPKDLINQLDVDATVLADAGDRLLVSDIQVPTGVTIMTDGESVVAHVETPKDQLAEADASAASLAEDAGASAQATPADTPTETEVEAPTEE